MLRLNSSKQLYWGRKPSGGVVGHLGSAFMGGLRQWLCGMWSVAASIICHVPSPTSSIFSSFVSHLVISFLHCSLCLHSQFVPMEYREALEPPNHTQPLNLDFQHLEWKKPVKTLFFTSPMLKCRIIASKHWTDKVWRFHALYCICVYHPHRLSIVPATFIMSLKQNIAWDEINPSHSFMVCACVPIMCRHWSSIGGKSSEDSCDSTIHRRNTIRKMFLEKKTQDMTFNHGWEMQADPLRKAPLGRLAFNWEECSILRSLQITSESSERRAYTVEGLEFREMSPHCGGPRVQRWAYTVTWRGYLEWSLEKLSGGKWLELDDGIKVSSEKYKRQNLNIYK